MFRFNCNESELQIINHLLEENVPRQYYLKRGPLPSFNDTFFAQKRHYTGDFRSCSTTDLDSIKPKKNVSPPRTSTPFKRELNKEDLYTPYGLWARRLQDAPSETKAVSDPNGRLNDTLPEEEEEKEDDDQIKKENYKKWLLDRFLEMCQNDQNNVDIDEENKMFTVDCLKWASMDYNLQRIFR